MERTAQFECWESRRDTRIIAADELARIRNYLDVWPTTVGTEHPEGVPLAKQLLAHADALADRLDQSITDTPQSRSGSSDA